MQRFQQLIAEESSPHHALSRLMDLSLDSFQELHDDWDPWGAVARS